MKKPKQLEFQKIGGWGGHRAGAGRPNRTKTVNHMCRPSVDFNKPLHITYRLRAGIPSLRRERTQRLFRRSLRRAKDVGLHVIHYSLLGNHVHMIVEAPDNRVLRSGMVSLAASFALSLQKKLGLTGGIFAGRYHLTVIKTPTQMKHVLKYVLLNYCNHSKMLEHLDPFSSARFFADWRKLLGRGRWNGVLDWEVQASPEDPATVGLSPPQSWLARQGWQRAA